MPKMTAAERYRARKMRQAARLLARDIERSNQEHISRLLAAYEPHVPTWRELVENAPDPSWVALQSNAIAARYAAFGRGVV